MSVNNELAQITMEIGAVKINTEAPFTWASGYRMPVYNDNRMLLGDAAHRERVTDGFAAVLEQNGIKPDVVAGTATAGIAPATGLANRLKLPLIYVRPAAKEHGMKNRIEGILKPGQQVVLVEDVVSTAGSALNAVEAIRQAGGQADHCLAIFEYGFPEAKELFSKAQCELHRLLSFADLLQHLESNGALMPDQLTSLREWYRSPFTWAETRGFPRKRS